ncbi:hypothetical protein FOMPIDRAFT_1087805, partial [Fomitopsis schrenkii]
RLLECAKCRRIHYCSRECQKKNWARHKDTVFMDKWIQHLYATDRPAVQKALHWTSWREVADLSPYVSALRLRDDPGRARTHIVFEQSAHTPNAGPRARDKFTVLRCGVFRLSDVLAELEHILGLVPGSALEYFAGLVKDCYEGPLLAVDYSIVRFGDGIIPALESGS